jgi:hypothetical protein
MKIERTPEQVKSFKALQLWLKQHAKELRNCRIEKIGKPHMLRLRYRAHHLAYCLLRGRTVDECERVRYMHDWLSVWLPKQYKSVMEQVTNGTFAFEAKGED